MDFLAYNNVLDVNVKAEVLRTVGGSLRFRSASLQVGGRKEKDGFNFY
jgi:hypothetical protein